MSAEGITENTLRHIALEDTLKRALALLTDQCNELEGRVGVLSRAIKDIEYIARRMVLEPGDGADAIVHICTTGGVRTALEA